MYKCQNLIDCNRSRLLKLCQEANASGLKRDVPTMTRPDSRRGNHGDVSPRRFTNRFVASVSLPSNPRDDGAQCATHPRPRERAHGV